MRIFFIILFLFLSSFYSYSEESLLNLIIKGEVISLESKLPVSGAVIRVEHTSLGAVSDQQGKFSISNLAYKPYKLIITAVGYETKYENLTITEQSTDTLSLKIILKENIFKTSEIVVSANKQIEAVQDVPISLSVIDSRQIISRVPTLIEDALKYVPGVTVNQQNISIRGSSGFAFGLGSRVALLIDGFPMLSGDNGDIKYDIFPVNQIERIEVVKGAGSALYGTAAIGGVVNIISKEPSQKPTLGFRLFSGFYTQPTYKQWRYRSTVPFKSGIEMNYSQSIEKFSYLISGQYLRDESYMKYDDFTKWNALAKLKYNFSELTSLTLMSNYASDNATDWVYWNSLDSATIPPTNTNTNIRIFSKKLFVASELKHIFTPDIFSTLKLSILNTQFNNTYPTDNIYFRQSDAMSYNLELLTNHRWNNRLNFTYGLNFNHNTVKSVIYDNQKQDIYSAYAQGEMTYIKNLIITAGGRFDLEQTENTGTNLLLSPKIGFNYSLYENTHLRLSAGRGFRAPNIAEKYASINFQGFKVVPNPQLKPEKSWSAEIGGNQKIQFSDFELSIDGAGFVNFMNNLIEPTFDMEIPNAPIKFLNITRARIIGAEITANAILWNLINIQTAITMMDPKDLTLNETLKYRNNFIWYSSVGINMGLIEIQADYKFMSKVQNMDEFLALQIKDFDARVPIHVVDARIIFNGNKIVGLPIRLSLNARNILNYYYTEVPGNLGPTRHINFQLEGSF